ncbi:hypothetical protein niasHS_002594 [Heterodera schachtii]|uniref:Transient receptor potential channel n=1 Tax=Heterodera schachtii TaxID=97005 RepID=A0ABD2KKP2_HETSC
MNGNLCPRSQSVSSDGIVQSFPATSAASIPSSIYPIHQHKKSISGGIKHSQSQKWEPTIGGRETNETTASGGGETFVVRRKSPGYRDLFQRRVRQPPSYAWIERVFQRRDCIKFIPVGDHSDRCHCGRVSASHSQLALSRFTTSIVVRRGTDGDRSAEKGPNEERARWTIGGCTAPNPTDAYGVIQFQGGPHVHKARYVRLSFDSEPADVFRLLVREWGLSMPRLVITVHGGMADFEVPERVGKVFREGLLKAAETTGAWVLTAGVDSGVVKHIGRALDEAGISARMRSRIVTVGIAPWGLLQHRERLLGRNVQVPYDRHSSGSPSSSASARRGSSGGLVLNDRHSYFLLADNGTVGRYGADIVLRRRLEEFLASRAAKEAHDGRRGTDRGGRSNRIPIVSVVLEGGLCTLNLIHRHLTGTPSVPVIICEGSGRVSDILSFAARHLTDQKILPAQLRPHLLCQMRQLSCNSAPLEQMPSNDAILDRLVQCAQYRDGLLTIFRLHNNAETAPIPTQMDHAILRALLQAQNLSPVDQLLMTLVWGRDDIARAEIFGRGQNGSGGVRSLPMGAASLAKLMMEALLMSRVEFVKLFLEQGLSLKRFLTFDRLERLYNAEPAKDAPRKSGRRGAERRRRGEREMKRTVVTLPEIGATIERLMGNAYRSAYTTREFKIRYERAKFGGNQSLRKGATRNFSSLNLCLEAIGDPTEEREQRSKRKCALTTPAERKGKSERTDEAPANGGDDAPYGRKRTRDFDFPFNELMLWAVLTRRHEMAKFFWQYGEEPMAKALVAIRLYKCMSREAAHDYTEVEVSNQLRECANAFRDWSLELLHNCHQQDSQLTMRLLTAELPNWGHRTCLSLAVIANNKRFLAHPCCQILLAELWHGGLRFRSQSNFKVVLGILFPPSILLLDFKTNSFDNFHSNADTSFEEEEEVYEEEESISNDEKEEGTEGEGRRKQRGTEATMAKRTKSQFGKMSEMSEEGEEEQLIEEERRRSAGERQQQFVRCQCLGNGRETQLPTADPGWCRSFSCRMPLLRLRVLCRPSSQICCLLSKFVLFYCAPITSFWTWSISYATFMLALIFVLLIEFPSEVSPVEWFLFVYVLSFAMEHFRKLFVLESSSLIEKLSVFYSRYWNILTTVAVLSFFVGFLFRLNPSTVHTLSRTVLASNSVLWHMKLFDFLSVHPRIGPYITMAGKMVLAMSYIIVLLMVTLMAFGVEKLLGKVYAGEIDTCGDEGTNCVPGGWIPPVLMTIFLLVANILLINMLIAIFNNIFNVTNAMSQQVWMFQRYEQVLEYKSTPILPPPVTPLAHLLMLVRRFFKSKHRPSFPFYLSNRREEGSFALKMQLPTEELGELQDFEEDCMDDLSRRKMQNISDDFNGQCEKMGREEERQRNEQQQNNWKCCCCCCGGGRKSDRRERDIPRDREKGQTEREGPAEEGEEAEKTMSRHIQAVAESHSLNDVKSNSVFGGAPQAALSPPSKDSMKPVDNTGRRQLRVAPMPIMAHPRNSSSILVDDIDQMLVAMLSSHWGKRTKAMDRERDEGRTEKQNRQFEDDGTDNEL